MLTELEYRRFDALKGGKGPVALRGTFMESLAIAQVELPNQEMSRAGRKFMLGISAAVTGIAPVQAIPTTAAQWTIFNNEQAGGKSYFFEELGELLVSGTPGLGLSLWCAIYTTPANTGAQAAGFTVQNTSNSSIASKALIKSGVTLTTPAAPAWFPVADNEQNITAAAFSTGYPQIVARRDLAGGIALPPQVGIALAVLGPAGTTPLFAPFARWTEVETDME